MGNNPQIPQGFKITEDKQEMKQVLTPLQLIQNRCRWMPRNRYNVDQGPLLFVNEHDKT